MPISDEVIELAPVKKTKKTLIILLSAVGVLFAAAVAFLVLYLLKPSVTETPTVVRGVSVTTTGFFSVSDDGGEINYASIGNEYTVHSTIAVEKNTSPNILWRWEPHEALEIVESVEDGEDPHITFKPKMGFHGKEVTITAQSRADVNKSDTYKFTIVNQGTDKIEIKSYGANAANQKAVVDKDSLTIDVPYYNLNTLQKNNVVLLLFEQHGAFNNGVYAPRTLYEDKKTGNNSHDVSVTVVENKDIIQVNGVSTSKTGGRDSLQFTVKGSGEAVIRIDANVHNNTTGIGGNNVDIPIVSKTFKVNIQSNAQLDYVDSVYILDKPVVDENLIGASVDNNKTNIDPKKLGTEAAKKGAKLSTEKDVTLTLPYNAKYYDILDHVVLNPVKIQFVWDADKNGYEFRDKWYQNLSVKSSDEKIVKVTTDKDGKFTLETLALASNVAVANKCTLTITDTKGGLGINEKINVRVIAQNDAMTYSVSDGSATHSENADKPGLISIDAVPSASFTITLEYTFKAPKLEAASDLSGNGYINNVIVPSFEKSKLTVKADGKELSPDVSYQATAFNIANPTSPTATVLYKATLQLTVEIGKDVETGVVALEINKPGTALGDESEAINKLDRSFTKRVEFNVKVAATSAKLVGYAEGINIVTQGNTKGGNYEVDGAGNKATVYVQRETATTTLALTNKESEWFVKNLIVSEPASAGFNVELSFAPSNPGFRVEDNKFVFRDASNYNQVMGGFSVKVTNLGGKELATFNFDVYIIDVATSLVAKSNLTDTTVNYSATPKQGEYYTIKSDYIKIVREYEKTQKDYSTFSGVKLYCGETEDALIPLESDDGKIFYYRNKSGEKINLYSYDSSSSKRIIPLTDIYAQSYLNDVNLSHVFVEFLLDKSEEYVGKHWTEPAVFDQTCYIHLVFERNADDVALYSSPKYDKELTKEDGVYLYYVNQERTGTVYPTSVVDVGGTKVPANSAKGKIAAVVSSHIFVPSGFAVDNTTDDRYYEFLQFTAPKVTNVDKGFDTIGGFYAEATNDVTVRRLFSIVVQNVMRGIKSIEFYKEEGLTNQLSSTDVLLFGSYNKESATSRDVYVKVSYENDIDAYTSFENALITLPSYLSLDDPETRITADTEVEGQYRFSPNNGELKLPANKTDYYTWFKCTLVFSGTGAHNGDVFKVAQETSLTSRAIASCAVSVGTGLKSIIVSSDDFGEDASECCVNKTASISHKFNVNNVKSTPTLTLALDYEPLTESKYGIAFDHTSSKFIVNYDNNADAVLSVKNNATSVARTIVISLKSIKAITEPVGVDVTFTDKSDGVANIFTLHIEITVNIEIYKLDFGESGSGYKVTTTGYESADEQTFAKTPVTVVYNNGTDDYQPLQSLKDAVTVYVARLADGEYSKYAGADVYFDKPTGMLCVSDKLIEVSNLFVVAVYKIDDTNAVRSEYRPISVVTNANDLRLANNSGDVPVTDGVANITLTDTKHATFSLPAEAYNLSSPKDIVSGATIEYGIYTARDGNVEADCVHIDSAGNITFGTLTEPSGTVYYRARFVDDGDRCSGKTRVLVVEINYDVAVTSVVLKDLDRYTFDASTVYLYFYNKDAYTRVDLADYIFAYSEFYTGILEPITKTVTEVGATSILSITGGSVIQPTGVGTTTIKLTVEYNGVEYDFKTYSVIVRSIGGLSLKEDEGTIDLVVNNTLTVEPTIKAESGFNATYTLNYSGDKLVVSGAGDVKTVALASQTSGRKGVHILTAAVEYTLAAGSSSSIVGDITHSLRYTVNVVCDYTPDFVLKKGDDTIPEYNNTEENKYAISDRAEEYTLSITKRNDNATYSFDKNNGIITIDANNKVTTVANHSGEVTITLTATLYGEEFIASKKYYFAYGAEPDCSLVYSSNGTTYQDMPETRTLAVDYSTQKVLIKYVIAGVDTKTVTSDNISVIYSGNVTPGDITEFSTDGRTGYYVVFTVNGAGKFTVGGTVKVGARTVYLTTEEYALTATTPEFTLSATKTTLSSDPADDKNVTEISADANTGFKGNYEIESLTVIEGGALVQSVSGRKVTVKTDVTAGGKVVVRAKIKVTSGIYADTTYYELIELTVNGITRPTIAWNSSVDKTVAVKGKSTYSYTLSATTPESYSYTGKVSVVMSANGNGLTSGADFTFNTTTRELTVNETDKTKAGGKITLTVTATVNSGAHTGYVVSDSVDVIVLPKLQLPDVVKLANAMGEYDFNANNDIKPYVATHDGAIKNTDKCVIETLAIKSSFDAATFGISGSKLLITKNVTSETSLTVTVTVKMLAGAYAGQSLSGDVRVDFEVPSGVIKTVSWNESRYDTLERADLVVLPLAATSAINSVWVAVISSASDGLIVNQNGEANPTVSIPQTFNMCFVGDSTAAKDVYLGFTVKCANGKTYYSTATIYVNAVAVNVTKMIDSAQIEASYECMSGDSFVLSYSAGNVFTVEINNVTVSDDRLSASKVGSDILFTAETVSDDTDITVTVDYAVGTLTKSQDIKIKIKAPSSSDPLTLTSGVNTDIATGDARTIESTATVSTGYTYMSSITISAPSGDYLSKYFKSIQYGSETATTSLSTNSLTLKSNPSHNSKVTTFKLKLSINTTVEIPATDITVTYVGYNSDGSGLGWGARSQTYTATYTIQVVGNVTVTLDANGGLIGGATSTIVTEKYKSYYKKLTDPTRVGYKFDGWYTSATGGTKVENNSDAKVGKEAHTLYAHWTIKTYTVGYDANYANAATIGTTKTVTYGATYGALGDAPAREGHTFAGWYDSATDGNIITPSTVVSDGSATRTLYAHWTKNVYTVTLIYDNGTDSAYAVKVDYDDEFKMHLVIVPTYEDHEFLGWYDRTNAQHTAAITVKGDVVLTAKWATAYTVTLNNDGAIATVKYGEGDRYGDNDAFKVSSPSDRRFIGWSTDPAATTATECVNEGSIVTSSGTLYAIWKAIYVVTFNDGGTTTTAMYDDGAAYDSNKTAFKTLADTATHKFIGWSTDPYATVAADCVKDTDTVTTAHTLYAIWKDVYTVTLINGDAVTAVKYVAGAVYGSNEAFTLADSETQTFVGWSTKRPSETTDDDYVKADDIVTATSAHTLYAVFEAKEIVSE